MSYANLRGNAPRPSRGAAEVNVPSRSAAAPLGAGLHADNDGENTCLSDSTFGRFSVRANNAETLLGARLPRLTARPATASLSPVRHLVVPPGAPVRTGN
jgi:hypothetical protein